MKLLKLISAPLLVLTTACASSGTAQISTPPRCTFEKRILNYQPLQAGLFQLAPVIRKHDPNSEYGDPYAITRGARTNTQRYNNTVIPNLKKSSANQDKVIAAHNEKMVKLQAECDRSYQLWIDNRKASAKKQKKILERLNPL